MVAITGVSQLGQATVLIGAVLVEAVLLHVGYGVLINSVGPSVQRAIRGT